MTGQEGGNEAGALSVPSSTFSPPSEMINPIYVSTLLRFPPSSCSIQVSPGEKREGGRGRRKSPFQTSPPLHFPSKPNLDADKKVFFLSFSSFVREIHHSPEEGRGKEEWGKADPRNTERSFKGKEEKWIKRSLNASCSIFSIRMPPKQPCTA